MRAARKLFFQGALVLFAVLATACKREVPAPAAVQTASSTSALAAISLEHHVAPPWFDGSADQAFARAKTEGSLVFLYWGAAWCPPCNELKAAVFNKPGFKDLMQGFVPVYLDGDTPDAQRLGETFSVLAYPTILILGPEREELLRLGGSLDANEVERALASVRGKSLNFRAAMTRLSEGKTTADDCSMLAHSAWELLPEEEWPRAKIISLLRSADTACIGQPAHERAMLISELLGMAVLARNDPSAAAAISEIEPAIHVYFDRMFASADTAWAARAFINNRASDMAEWLDPKKPDQDQLFHWKSRWLDAADLIRARNEATVDVRLSTYLPMVELEKHAHPDKPVSESIRNVVVQAVEQADKDAKTQAERHAVISTAAYLLRQVGLPDKAKTMLLSEAEHTDTPFYYYSTLAAQEQALGHMDEAKKWTRKARETASGRATRLQWITHDVLLNAKPNTPDERRYLLELADEFYKLATSLDDGFAGRNRQRANQVKKAVSALQGEDVDKLLAKYRAACERLAGPAQTACHSHFE